MNEYTVFSLPNPASVEDVDRWIAIRLTALRLDPFSFRTSYETALTFPRSEQEKRVNNPLALTLGAKTLNTGEWVATAAVLAVIPADLPLPVRQDLNKTAYLLMGLWVHPEHRRKGLTRRMFELGMKWARKRDEEDGAGKYVAVGVFEDNPARGLYPSLGFEERGEHVDDVTGKKIVWFSMPL